MRNYNKSNCTGIVRGQITDKYGRKITIQGVHAFEYTIVIETPLHTITIEQYTNGAIARKRFNELKKKR